LSKVRFVIPNRAESPVRNLLFAGRNKDSLRDENALMKTRFGMIDFKLTHCC